MTNYGSLAFIDLAFAKSVLKKSGGEKEEHAAFLAVLFAFSRQGHLALDVSHEMLVPSLHALGFSDVDVLAQLVQRGANTLRSPFVCSFRTLYYLQKNWTYETEILKNLERIYQHPPLIELPNAEPNTKLNLLQKEAVEKAMKNSLLLLTGGPGTGKTFTAAAFVKTCLEAIVPEKLRDFRILLTAPTGKAVAQLEGNLRCVIDEGPTIHSGTLHAVLGIRGNDKEEEENNTLFADLIIVDESSMIDARIFSLLLASVPSGARLLLIGDKNQLPPIEAGSIFADLIDANVYPCVHLMECLRSDRTEILDLAEQIKQGNANAALDHLKKGEGIDWVDMAEKKITPAELWEECKGHFIVYELEKPDPEQILGRLGRFSLLSAMRKGPLGVDAINCHFLYQSLKTVPEGAWWIAPIMITRNDYDLELYNGDLGFLVRKYERDFSLRGLTLEDYALFHGKNEAISALTLPIFEYSYCLSIHKSQGSEYDETLILIPPGSERFGREAIYTAVTRARQRISLMADVELLKQSISRSSKKISGLAQRLSQR